MFAFLRRQRAARLLATGAPRRIRIHSLAPVPADVPRPDFVRVAFEFLDPPGPWSMQFYEAGPADALATLSPGTTAWFYESEDGARVRLLKTEAGVAIWPR